MQFCSTPLPSCEEEPSCNIYVFWWQLLITKEISTFACRYSRFFEVHTYYSECWPSRRVKETQWLLDEIQQQPSVFVLSGPATVITNVATASAFPADAWSTESVSRVLGKARTRQENNERERAEHAHYSLIHDEVTISNVFTDTGQGLDGGEHPAENTIPEDDQEDVLIRLVADTKTNCEDP